MNKANKSNLDFKVGDKLLLSCSKESKITEQIVYLKEKTLIRTVCTSCNWNYEWDI